MTNAEILVAVLLLATGLVCILVGEFCKERFNFHLARFWYFVALLNFLTELAFIWARSK